MADPFEYHVGDRTVRVTAKDGDPLTTEQAKVVALVKIGDELAGIKAKLSHFAQHGLHTGGKG
jgi:uncharacterized membrane protein YqiK